MLNITTRDIAKCRFPEKKKFFGVKLTELSDLEHLFEVNLFVYCQEPSKPDGEEGEEDMIKEDKGSTTEIAAQLIHRSLCHYPSTLYLNLYQNHFSYIKDIKKYAKSYCCSRCGTYWKDGFKLRWPNTVFRRLNLICCYFHAVDTWEP